MIKYLFAALALCCCLKAYSQSEKYGVKYNFGMEEYKADSTWSELKYFKGYEFKIDTAIKHSGRQSLRITRTDAGATSKYCPFLFSRKARYLGSEIQFEAWLKLENVTDYATVMINQYDVDGNSVGFKSLERSKIHGTKDWQLYSVKVALAPNAAYLSFGCILGGGGKLWMDDMQLLIDGKDVTEAATNPDYNTNLQHHTKYGDSLSISGRVKLKDADLYYEIYGTGEPILLLHGDSQSIYAFTKQISDFSKRYKVIAVDTRGQGRSKDFTTGLLNYQMFADDMKQLLDALHVKKTNIVGWSDGGITGLLMAIKYPEYVNKLAITGANLEPTDKAVDGKALKEISKGLETWKKDTTAHARMEARLFTMMLNEPHIPVESLKSIKAPVLVMAGEQDVVLQKHTELIAKSIPGAQLHIFKGATHYVPVDKPADFNQQVLSFFNQQ